MILKKLKEYNGFLSKEGGFLDNIEWHAIMVGFFDGALYQSQNYGRHVRAATRLHSEVKKETHYYKAGYFVSNRAKYLIGFYLLFRYGYAAMILL